MESVILKTATRLMVGLMLVFAVYLLLRGHHEPGGGFSAALVTGTAFALFAITEGPGRLRQAIRIRPEIISATGLTLGAGSGLPALVMGKPYLTGAWWSFNTLALGTPMIFDMGVFLAVLGAILAVLLALEEN
ncbi:MnhB domain-containing protein [Desulfobacula sp.]|uniref:MnhB domain-containing protein n=1 Tax=Desulfobacula sp. TaxID=2593537 RepID=UPI002628DAE2|nr:MnhB domain-containing protein [Desulfobacula sp.]